jgi:hypothetical protein
MGNGRRKLLRECLTRVGEHLCCGPHQKFKVIFANFWPPSMISYPNYKFTFTIKALGMYARRYGDADIL